MAAEYGVVNLLIVGHSFVRRLANYALSAGEMNMNLNEGDCAVTFIGKGGMSVHQLRSHFDEIVYRGQDVLYVEIVTIDISRRHPLDIADEVFELARSFSARGVRRVVIAQIFVRNLTIGRRDYRVAPNFNERVVAYNLRMRELTQSTTSIELWRHHGMWANWANLLVDGLHFTDEGHRRYFNSVRGALVAAMNRLVGSVSLISCNYRNRQRFWWYRDHLSQSSSTLPAVWK